MWEHYGHNELVVMDTRTGAGRAYNYGLFEFDQPNFYRNFFRGDWRYRLAIFDAEPHLQDYVDQGRGLWMQRLRLTDEQKEELFSFLEWNAVAENSWYSYDAYKDNCSTRVRDALNRVLDGELERRFDRVASSRSYRFHTQRLAARDIFSYFSLLLLWGPTVDEPVTPYAEMFVPMRLRDLVREVTVPDGNGGYVSVVAEERKRVAKEGGEEWAEPPSWTLQFLLAGLLVGALLAGLGWSARLNVWLRRLWWGIAVLVPLAVAFAGCFVAYLWFFSTHEAAQPNYNLFHCHPLVAVLSLVSVLAAWRSERSRWLLGVAFGVAGVSLLGALLKWVGVLEQENGPIVALFLPLHLGYLLAVWVYSRAVSADNVDKSASERPT